MKSRHRLHWLVALSSALAAAPALGAEADLSAQLSLNSASATIAQGSSWVYKIVITNAGPSHATDIILDATLPSDLKFVGIASGCDSADGKLPCKVSDIIDGSSATVTLSVKWPLPEAVPATCPNSLGNTSVTVSATTSDPQVSNNTASLTHTVVPYADIEATFDGPKTANVGDVIDFTVTVTNLGPCASEGVALDASGALDIFGGPLVGAGLTLQSSEIPCVGVKDTDDGLCALNTLKSGDSVSFKKTYKVESLPSSLTSTGNPNGVEIAADTFDPNGDNDVATTATVVTSPSGCSASGVASPALATALAALFAFRRRSARV